MREKTCSDCNLIKPLNEFWNNKANSDGKDGICSDCRRQRSKKYREINPDRLRQYDREYKRKRNPLIGKRRPDLVKTDIEWKPAYNLDGYSKETGFIYLIQEKEITNYVKIGKTKNFRKRKKSLGNCLPFTLNLETIHVAKTNDMHRIERKVHLMFHSKKRKGEWFELSEKEIDEAIKFLNANKRPGD